MRETQPPPTDELQELRFDAPPWVHLALVVSTLVTLWCAGFIYLGPLVAAPVVGAGAIALLAWRLTTYRRPASQSILPLFVVAIVVLSLHTFERWYLGYASVLNERFPSRFIDPVVFSDRIFLSVFGPALTALLLWAALGVYLRHPLGNYAAWFLFVWSVLAPLSDVVLTFASSDPGFVPGVVTGVLPLAAGAYGMSRLIREGRAVAVGERR